MYSSFDEAFRAAELEYMSKKRILKQVTVDDILFKFSKIILRDEDFIEVTMIRHCLCHPKGRHNEISRT